MFPHQMLLALLTVSLAGLAVDAQEAHLAWKFQKGVPFYVKHTTETEQDMKVQGSTDVQQKQTQTLYFSWTPTDIDDKKKEVTLKQKIVGLKMSIEIGGSKISCCAYNSTKKSAAGTPNPLNKLFEALNGAEFKTTLDTEKMTVKSITGLKEFVSKLGAANPQMKPLLDKILSEKALKDMAEPMLAALPGVKKKKGESWDKTSDLDMGPIGSCKMKYTYTYDGPDAKKNEVIKVKTGLTYKAPADARGGLPFRITAADFKFSGGTGKAIFNPETGRVASLEVRPTLKGTLKIEIGQQETEVMLEQRQTTTITTSSQDFLRPNLQTAPVVDAGGVVASPAPSCRCSRDCAPRRLLGKRGCFLRR